MFEAIWKRERVGVAKAVAVAALAAIAFAGQAAFFSAAIGAPLQDAIAGVRALPAREPTRDDLPEMTEEIVVVAPHRAGKPAKHARVGPWRSDARSGGPLAAVPCTPEG